MSTDFNYFENKRNKDSLKQIAADRTAARKARVDREMEKRARLQAEIDAAHPTPESSVRIVGGARESRFSWRKFQIVGVPPWQD